MEVALKPIHKDAKIPTYATDGSGCFDIYGLDFAQVGLHEHTFSTGLTMAIPKDHVLLLFSRSGHGFNEGIRLANCVGVIDEDYRGEIKVKLTSDRGFKNFIPGDRIAQGLVIPREKASFTIVEQLPETERGQGGFGSSGS